jgi:hypothetical protein
MRFGILTDEPIADYHAADCTSHSKLEILRDPDRGPARYYLKFIAKVWPAEGKKDHFDVGSAIDALLLEGEAAFRERFEIIPPDAPKYPTSTQRHAAKPSPETVKAVAWWNEFEAKTAHLTTLTVAQERNVYAMRDAALANPDFAALISKGAPQVTFRVRFRHFAIQVRPDWYNPEGVILPSTGRPTGPYMLDLKSAEDFNRFEQNRREFGYNRQAATYRDVVAMTLAEIGDISTDDVPPFDWYFGTVFKDPPVDAAVFKLSHEDMSEAADEVREDLAILRTCYERNEWPACPRGIHELPRQKRWDKKPRPLF